MSIRLMSEVWDMDLPAFEKLVLLALADCANDEGIAWPSIATLQRKTSAGERTVQRSIQSLKSSGILEREEINGKGCKYRIYPRRIGTPATVAPVSDRREPVPERHPTPATVAPKPSKNHKNRNNRAQRPDDVTSETWRDFTAMRDKKGAIVTDTALRGIRREAEKAGWSLEDALVESASRGWRGFKAEWVRSKQGADCEFTSFV